jgi:sec-independent protein translocase protein TatC
MPNVAVERETEKEGRGLGSMSLLQHLEELRRRIIYSVAAAAICTCVGWYFSKPLYEKMSIPIKHALSSRGFDPTLWYQNPTDPFNTYLKIGLIAGLFIASPIVLYQVWMFISPGLYRNEKRYILPFMFFSVGLFICGGIFGYKIVYPGALDFLIAQADAFKPIITINEYTSLFLTIMIGLGIIFELPIVVGFAALMGVVTPRFLFKHIRGAIFTIFLIAAILTPTTDPLNMTIFAAPMVLLYLVSIAIAWFLHPAQRRKRREKREKESGDRS